MDHDDLVPPLALYCMGHAIVHNPTVKLLYSDEDKINQAGEREGPYFKSEFRAFFDRFESRGDSLRVISDS